MFDLVIRGGMVFDGTGAPGVLADVAITGDRVVEVGHVKGEAAEVIDASGMAVTPGFIDVHSHDDLHVFTEPDVAHNAVQGITTMVVGNCGFGAAPFESGKVQLSALNPFEGDVPSWDGYGGYFDALQSRPPSLNVAVLVGHHTARRHAMGGVKQRLPNLDELEMMRRIVAEGMEAGGVGLSTGLVYEPGRYSDTAEVVELAKVAARYGGVYVSHMRDEGAGLLDSIRETLHIGRAADCPVQVSHHKAVGKENWGKVDRSLEMIDRERSAGSQVCCDVYPYTARSTMLAALVQNGTFDYSSDGGAMGKSTPDEVLLCSVPGAPELEGRTLESFVEQFDLTAEDSAKKLLEDYSPRILVAAFGMDEGDVRTVLAHESTMIGTDGLDTGSKPHPRAWGTYPRILGMYVRDEGVISLANAIHKMTGMPAEQFSLKDRGYVRKDGFADLVVFDPRTVIDGATYEEPRVSPVGMPHVIVNGRFVIRDGRHTHERAGMAVRRGM